MGSARFEGSLEQFAEAAYRNTRELSDDDYEEERIAAPSLGAMGQVAARMLLAMPVGTADTIWNTTVKRLACKGRPRFAIGDWELGLVHAAQALQIRAALQQGV